MRKAAFTAAPKMSHHATKSGRNARGAFREYRGAALGLIFDHEGNLIVADANKGLLSIAPNGSITTLSTEAEGTPFRCRTIWTWPPTASSISRMRRASFRWSTLPRISSSIRVTDACSPTNRKPKLRGLALKNLCFANGVAVSPDQSFVLVVETGKYRIHRVWLNGPKRGSRKSLSTIYRVFPMAFFKRQGQVWLALVTPRDPVLDRLLPASVSAKGRRRRLPKLASDAETLFLCAWIGFKWSRRSEPAKTRRRIATRRSRMWLNARACSTLAA